MIWRPERSERLCQSGPKEEIRNHPEYLNRGKWIGEIGYKVWQMREANRGQGDNWKVNSNWILLPSLAWRTREGVRRISSTQRQGSPQKQRYTFINTVLPQLPPFSHIPVFSQCLPLAKPSCQSVMQEPPEQGRGSGRNGAEVIHTRTVLHKWAKDDLCVLIPGGFIHCRLDPLGQSQSAPNSNYTSNYLKIAQTSRFLLVF